MSVTVQINNVSIDGWEPPHNLKIVIEGAIGQKVDDGIITAMHRHGHELRDAIAPTIEEAVQSILLDREEPADDVREIGDFEI